MGFAEGFVGGYGLVDASMRAQRNEQLLRDNAAQQNDQFKQTLGLHNATLEETKRQHEEAAAVQRETLAANREHQAGQLEVAKQNADSVEQSRKDTAAYQRAQVGLEAQRNSISAAQANASIEAHTLQARKTKLETDQLQREQIRQDAQRELLANYTGPDSTPIIPNDPEGFGHFSKLIEAGYGVKIDAIAKNVPKYHAAVGALKTSFMAHGGGEVNSDNDPKAMRALNLIYGNQINTGIGEETERGTVVRKEAANILPHKVKPTPDNPSGMVYSIGIKTTYRNKDGKEVTDSIPSPMTQFRSNDKEADPNARFFTDQQLFQSINGHAALIDAIATDPTVKAQIQVAATRNKIRKPGETEYQPIMGEVYHPDTMTSEKTITGAFNKGNAEYILINPNGQSQTSVPTGTPPAGALAMPGAPAKRSDPAVNDRARRAQKVLSAPDKFTPEQVQAAKALMATLE